MLPSPHLMAPLARAPMEEIQRQHGLVSGTDAVREILEDLPLVALVVNAQRQIVYANRAAATLFAVPAAELVLGRRFGETVQCVHSRETAAGCGTTEFCVTCGAATALLATETTHAPASRACRIINRVLGSDLDLRV